MTSLDAAIDDFTASVLIRYFRKGRRLDVIQPHIKLARDLDLIRAQWALSQELRDLLTYILSHKHEAQSLLAFRRASHDSVARGRINARATVQEQLVTGHPSIIIAEEPVRSFNTGPNLLLAWVVQTASAYAGHLMNQQADESAYRPLIEEVLSKVSAIKRIESLREPLNVVSLHRRPSSGAVQLAARARCVIYRKAVTAYRTLIALEAGDEEALRRLLDSTLIGPLENWRRFELAVALGVGEALEDETGEIMNLQILGKPTREPMLTCGRYALYWQSGGGLHKQPPLEPSEVRLEGVLHAYGMKLAGDRPDLVLVDNDTRSVRSIIEVKYLAGDTGTTRFREAAGQIVRYARGYTSETGVDDLVRASLIAISSNAPSLQDDKAAAPSAVDYNGLKDGRLNEWLRERMIPSPQ